MVERPEVIYLGTPLRTYLPQPHCLFLNGETIIILRVPFKIPPGPGSLPSKIVSPDPCYSICFSLYSSSHGNG